jgi:Zn-dependent protease
VTDHHWCWRPGRVAGIPIRLDASLLLQAALCWLIVRPVGPLVAQLLAGSGLLLALLASTLLHELAHALMARRLGEPVGEISLGLLGGTTQLTLAERPDWAGREFVIVLAGPIANLLLALPLWLMLDRVTYASPTTLDWPGVVLDWPIEAEPLALLIGLGWLNLAMAAYNLVPIYPLDGGRLVRALLGLYLGHRPATRLTLGLGLVLASGMLAIGLWQGWLWLDLLGSVGLGLLWSQRHAAATATGGAL